MHAFDVLGDPVRRRILELLVDDELTSGAITTIVRDEFGISQPAVSQHLRVLRDSGFVRVRADGARRHYAARRRAAARRRHLARPVPSVLGAAPRRPRHRDRPRQAGPPPDLTADDGDCRTTTRTSVGEAVPPCLMGTSSWTVRSADAQTARSTWWPAATVVHLLGLRREVRRHPR